MASAENFASTNARAFLPKRARISASPAMREGLGRPPHLLRVPTGAVKRLMATFGKEREWERLSGDFVIDAGKLRGIGWDPRVKTYDGIAAMMREPNGAAGS